MKSIVNHLHAAVGAALLMLLPLSAAGAIGYNLTVGGVKVTSDNCANITGSAISPLDDKKPYSAVFDPDSKTLTLTNISIVRIGKYNRAIYNTGIPGLKVVFVGKCRFIATGASPLRFESETTLTSEPEEGASEVSATYVAGGSQDAITVVNSTLTFDGAKMNIYAYQSAGIIGNSKKETVKVYNSVLQWKEDAGYKLNLEHNGVGVKNLAQIDLDNAYFFMGNYTNVKSITYGESMFPFFFDGYYYTRIDKLQPEGIPTSYEDGAIFAKGIEISRANFSDSIFWRQMFKYQNDSILDHILMPIQKSDDSPMLSTGDMPSNPEFIKCGIKELTGINLFPHITSLDVNGNDLVWLPLYTNMNLRMIWVMGNNINGYLPGQLYVGELFVNSLPDRTGKEAGRLFFKWKDRSTEKNALTPEEVQTAKSKNWKVLYNDGTEYTGEDLTGINDVTTKADDTNAPTYNLKGQRVGKDYKGVVIQNGKKRIIR